MVRGGLIGCGQIVEEMHMPAWRAIPEVRIEFVCDRDPERLGTFARKHDVKKTYVLAEQALAENPDIDFVSIATPGFTHYELASMVIEAGVDLLVEKPVALSLSDAQNLQRQSHQKGVRVCVAHTSRFRDPVLRAKEACDRGLVGEIYQIKISHHGESFYHAAEPAWRWREQAHKILLYDLAIHLLDLEVYFGGPVEELQGLEIVRNPSLGATTHVYAIVKHTSGAVGCVDFQMFASSNFSHFAIYGTVNDIRIKFFPHYYRLYSGRVSPLDELYHDFVRIWDFVVPTLKQKFRRKTVPRRVLPHYRLFRQFADALSDDATPMPVPVESVIPTMEFLERLGSKVYGDGT